MIENMRITIGLLAIILLGIAMLDSYAYAQGPTSIGNKEPGYFIRRWLALGPIIEGEPAPKAIETDYLLAATGILESKFATLEGAPKPGDSVTLTLEGYVTQERIWKVLELPENDSVDAMLVKEEEVDLSVAYLLTFIDSKEATRRELRIGSDDAVSESLNLQSGIRRVVFSFRAISFKTRPGGIKYFYQLVGKGSDWQGPTNNETVEYFDLKSGQYTFKVQAVDRDLNYSKIASVTFKIRPPFYMTTAFIVPTVSLGTILLITFTVLSIGFVKNRRRVLAYQKLAVQELQDARQMQMSLVPESVPPLEGVEIAGKCVPANTVSGDFFDYLPSKHKSQIGIVIADVTGKGLKGAMNAVMTDGILHMAMKGKEKISPASLLMEINDILKARMERDMNVTMVIGLMDAEKQTLTLANAGHHIYPILLRNGEIQFLKAKGLPVGMKAGIRYGEEQFPLGNGDAVIFMTDGIIEARDKEDKLYLESGRLEQTISQFSGNMNISAEAMVEAIIADAIDFSGSKDSRDDDMTVVVVKVL